MNKGMSMEIKPLTNIMAMVMLVLLSFNFSYFFGLRAINLKATPATTAVPRTPITPAIPTEARSLSTPLVP
jgi:hypothetical protein